MINQRYDLNLIPGQTAPLFVHVSQYDVGSRTLVFGLINGTEAYTIPSGMTALFNGIKPDGYVFSYDMTVDRTNNVVKIDIEEQMAAVAGNVTCEVALFLGSDRLGTANLILEVERSPMDGGVASDSDLESVEHAITLIESAVSSTHQDMLDAAASAQLASDKASIATSAATTATNKAGEAAASATTASNKAGEAAASATTASNKAGEASNSATTASNKANDASNSASAAATAETNAKNYRDQAKEYRDQAAGYAGAATYSFMVDSEGYICLNYKEDPE